MAHALRYYKNITHADGTNIRIEFHEKDGIAPAMELGDVIQVLNLEIQGGDDIDAPIVKTQLNFTLVDAPDHTDSKTKKCGAWEEFYSSDATHWKVLVFADGQQMWGGYITPDSYHEVLIYRSGISFVARDNIGHLNDFPFDATGNTEGMISMSDLVQTAWRKIDSPMQLTTNSANWLKCEGVSGVHTYMNVSAFEGKNWYEVLESTLYAYGLVMRYVGENRVAVYPLREMPFYGKDSTSVVNVKFETGAERELSPAARRIEETADYDIEETISRPLVKAREYSGAVADVTIEGKNVFGETIEKTAKANPLSKTSGYGWYNPSKDGAMLLNPLEHKRTQVSDYLASDMLFLLNTKNTEVVYSTAMIAQNLNIRLVFGALVEIFNNNLIPIWFDTLSQIKYAISATQNGITQYWDGSDWVSKKTELSANFDNAEVVLNCNARSFTGEIALNLHIYSIRYKSSISTEDAAYACLNSFTFASAESPALLTTNRVNTNYIDSNNVILSRQPVLAPAMNTPFAPAVIKNGIFRKDGATYVAASTWSWNGSGAQQMAVYNHLQLLCYYGKPNNILSGTIVNGDVTNFAKLYRWNGAEHIIVSGVLNLISGFIENAQLREFASYDEMWGDLTDAADFPEVEGGQSTIVDGGTSSNGASASYANTTEVNISGGVIIDDYMSDNSTHTVQNRVIKAYVDSEIEILDNNISHWKNEIETDIYIIKPSINLFNKADYAKGYYSDDGVTFVDTDSFWTTGFMPVESGVRYTRLLDYTLYVYAYDANKNPVVVSDGKVFWTGNTKNIMIPDGVAYVRVLFRPANLDTFMYCKTAEYPSSYSPYEPRKTLKIDNLEEELTARIDNNEGEIKKSVAVSNSVKLSIADVEASFNPSVNLFNKADYVEGIYGEDGLTYSEHPTIWTTGFMPVVSGLSYTRSHGSSYYIYTYDAGFNFVALISGNTKTIEIPEGVSYLRVCFPKDNLDSFMYCRADEYPSIYTPFGAKIKDDALPSTGQGKDIVKSIRIFRRVGCVGDSYTAGYIETDEGRTILNEDYAWAKYMEVMTGAKWDNFGKTGSSVKSWMNGGANLDKVKATGNKCQAYIIGLMLNDRVPSNANYVQLGTSADIGTDADSYYAYYYKLIQELVAVNNKAIIFCTTCPTFDKDFGYNVAVRDLVAYCANRGQRVHCIDLAADKYRLSQRYYANPVFMADYINAHYSPIGYQHMAECYMDILSEYMNNNISAFQNVSYIPYDK